MIIDKIRLNGKEIDFNVIIGNEFAEAFQKYNFKDMDEVNMVYQWQGRCTEKGLYSWCPADTRNLKKYLGMEE